MANPAQKKTLVILAAGVGRRFGGEKQLESVGPSGELLLDYAVFDAKRSGFNNAVIVIQRGAASLFQRHIKKIQKDGFPIHLAYQETPNGRKKPLGTGAAVLAAGAHVDGPFCVINADDFYGRESYDIMTRALDDSHMSEGDFLMVTFKLKETLSSGGSVSRGICEVSKNSELIRIREAERIEKTTDGARFVQSDGGVVHYTGDELVSMNMWGLVPSIFPVLKDAVADLESGSVRPDDELYLPAVIDRMIRENRARVSVKTTPATWMGVTYLSDLESVVQRIERLTKAGVYPEPLFSRKV